MATIYDIANKTQLSPATVSRVLSGKKTSEENRRKVLSAARELNYHNIAFAEPQRSGAPRQEEPSRAIIYRPGRNGLDGAYAAARELGYSVLLISSIEHSEEYIRHLLDSGAAQGMLLNSDLATEFIEECSRNYHTVVVGIGGQSHTVWIDHEAAIRALMLELLEHGRRRIWCFSSTMLRFAMLPELLRQVAGQYGVTGENLRFFDATPTFFSQSFADHLPLVEQLLALPAAERPDGLILPNSVVASCVVNLLRSRGVRVPEELSIVSAIGGEHDRACEPYLTSVLPPFYELNYEGMKMLDRLICGRVSPQEVRYPYQIHYGGSTRPELGSFGESCE